VKRGAWLWPLFAVLALAGCKKRLAPGTCIETLDCPAGFNCADGRCVEREKPPWLQTGQSPPQASSAGAGQGNLAPLANQPGAAGAGQKGTAAPQVIYKPPPAGKPYRPPPQRTASKRFFPPDS